MKVISVNIAEPRTIEWQGRLVKTGIYKFPSKTSIYLGDENVKGDIVADRKVHGGKLQACYLLSTKCYEHFKPLFPNLNWHYGMFGENLTIDNLDDRKIHVGNVYQIGDAIVEITKPRRPCYKLGVKFETQNILKYFIDFAQAGPYVRILKNGYVNSGDQLKLINEFPENVTIHEVFKSRYLR